MSIHGNGMTERRLEGRVAIVTGGGGGIGRAHALELAQLGAHVVINDFGGSVEGSGSDASAPVAVVDQIVGNGGKALADAGDVGCWADAEQLVKRALQHFGKLDILINNAGILRPRTIIGMSEDEMASVVRVHLLGSFATTHFAGIHWRERFKADGTGGGRLINTTSASGLFGIGQANYAAAKAAIAAMTQVAAAEFARYGATANAIAPIALTRMSGGIAPENFTSDHIARLVGWLATESAANITGRVFQVGGGHISVVDGWHIGAGADCTAGWSLDQLDRVIPDLVAAAAPPSDIMGYRTGDTRSPLLPDIELPNHGQSPVVGETK